MAAWIKMLLVMEVGLSQATKLVLDGDPARSPKRDGTPPQKIFGHVYCGQTAGWMRMTLGMEVGLDQATWCMGTQIPPKKDVEPPTPIFGPFLLWPNG